MARERRFEVFDFHLHAHDTNGWDSVDAESFGTHGITSGTAIKDQDELLRRTIQEMDRANVLQGLVSGEHTRDWIRQFPRRFSAGLAITSASLRDAQRKARRFEREVEAGHWSALGEVLLPWEGVRIDDRRVCHYYAVAERQRIPVLIHSGLGGPNPHRWSPRYDLECGRPLLVRGVLRRFPDLRVVLYHMGWPYFDEALFMAYSYENISLDTGVVDWILGRRLFERLLVESVDVAGAERVLFGSDQMVWPQMIPRAVRSIVASPSLTHREKSLVLKENAVRLLKR
jgi:uncharacterized protein